MKFFKLLYLLLPIGAIACLSACSVPGWHHSIPSPTTTPSPTTKAPVKLKPKPLAPGKFVSAFSADGLSPFVKVDAKGTPYVVAYLDDTLWTCYPGKGFTIGARGAVRISGWTCSTKSTNPAAVLGFAALTNGKIARG